MTILAQIPVTAPGWPDVTVEIEMPQEATGDIWQDYQITPLTVAALRRAGACPQPIASANMPEDWPVPTDAYCMDAPFTDD